MIMRALIAVLLLITLETVQANDPYPRNDDIDVRHYAFSLSLNDSTNLVRGSASVEISFKKSWSSFELDLINVNGAGQGMKVLSVLVDQQPVSFTHENDRLKILAPTSAGLVRTFTITYEGVPQDGLIISK